MKHTAFAGLFISAALLASPVFAADNDLCTAKLQELQDKVTTLPATSENTTMEIKRLQGEAEAAKAAGDEKKCVTEATQALSRVDKLRNEPKQ
ncbi:MULTISPECIES: hypothetical protein [unclassified Pseudomonas]|uniref:hypothetical protein n=1 Tax=unclassified Pseudomonas TaxID=196821 RepID=UPI00119A0FEE|nr:MULTISPECIES: hypothetical protein [unclassified Pseudomonas]TWC11940.1 hypothetical protein FBY00_12851 [Pseudomonas sp. SJZ075]TWC18201.1 hypothetical protein FBX99_115131 [Pseudomonas sp. SJZ074]TWC28529.1 hypothetical protein FBY02_12921 [Pseudomonas sp. SJZ078]TWC36173.1 hypothetical protein FBY06_115131 [Pseudomonas sp. SJZ085]TWC48527.1 hypothetical protein FBY11_12851 [Pseudomonas sp. SJZ124]